MKRRMLVAVSAGLLLALGVWTATAVGAGTDGRGAFSDDDGSVHEANINGLAASEISKGCNPPANTQYCPERPVTRAEMATFLVRGLQLPNTTNNTFDDTANSVHQNAIAALAQSGITKGCNPPANTQYCPERPVTRAEMATFLVRGLEDLEPRLNRIAMSTGLKCTKDGLTCSGRTTLAPGVQLEVVEGWHQALPYQEGEKSAFTVGGTRVDVTWNGNALSSTSLGLEETASLATRSWRARPPALTSGTHTLRAVWRWNGAVVRTATWTIVVPGR